MFWDEALVINRVAPFRAVRALDSRGRSRVLEDIAAEGLGSRLGAQQGGKRPNTDTQISKCRDRVIGGSNGAPELSPSSSEVAVGSV
jgi:hypothetical protein